MGKYLSYVLILMILIPFSFAETQIFSGNLITSQDNTIDSQIFRFAYDESANKVFAQTPSGGLIVDNGACKSNNAFKICISRANFSYRNSTTFEHFYEIAAAIYKLTGSLTTTAAVVPGSLLQGESAAFTVTITNPTSFDVTNIVYNQNLADFEAKDVKGCVFDGTQISWQGSLSPNYDRVCTATLTAVKQGTYSLPGNLTYFNSYETEKKAVSSTTVSVLAKQLKTSYTYPDYIEIRQPFYFSVQYENIHATEKADVIATIELPKNMALIEEMPGFAKDSNVLRHNDMLEHGAKKNYSFYLESLSEGENAIRNKFDYTIKNVRDIIGENFILNVTEPKLNATLTSEYGELSPGQKFIVFVKINNPSRFENLTGIKAKLDVPYNERIVQNLQKLKTNESYPIISSRLIVPKNADLIAEQPFILNLSIEYNLKGLIKVINKSMGLKLLAGESQNIPTPLPISNTTASESSNTSLEAQQEKPKDNTEITTAKFEDAPKTELWEKAAVGASILAIIIAVPALVYKISKKRKEKKLRAKIMEENLSSLNRPKNI